MKSNTLNIWRRDAGRIQYWKNLCNKFENCLSSRYVILAYLKVSTLGSNKFNLALAYLEPSTPSNPNFILDEILKDDKFGMIRPYMEKVNKVEEIINTSSDFRRDFVSLKILYSFTFTHRRALYSSRRMGAYFFHAHRLGEECPLTPTEKLWKICKAWER